MISKEEIIKAWVKIRKIDCSIPDEVLDFMKNASIEALHSKSCEGCIDELISSIRCHKCARASRDFYRSKGFNK